MFEQITLWTVKPEPALDTTPTVTDELQRAIYERLSANLSCSVYDEVPENAVFPYVTLGEDTESAENTLNRIGRNVTMTLHVWSQAPGFKEAKHIAHDIIELLEHQPLALNGFANTAVNYEVSSYLHDGDGFTRHGVLRFRFLVQA